MKYLDWKVLPAVLIITALSFNFAPAAPAAVGDIIKQFGATGGSWAGGGLTWREGYLWENARGSGTLYRRNPVTGAYMGTINYSIEGNKCVDVAWDTSRNRWWLTNPFAGLIERIPAGGGAHDGSFICTLWIAGIFYHEDTDRIWIGSNVNGGFGEYRTDGFRESVVNLDYTIQGIARVGDHIWVGGPTSFCTKLNLNGTATGVSFSLPNTGLMPQAFTFDGEYLWARGQAREGSSASPMVYQIDIGYNPPPSPTPSPAPTPAILVIDSGDYNGDGTSDYAVFRGSSGLWAVRGVTDFYYGGDGDIPVSGDYNGDGTTEAGIYRPSSGLWSIRGVTRAYFGSADDIPVPGDYTGSKRCNIGIFNSSSGLWAIRNVTRTYFGSAGDLPVPGYYDKDKPGVKLIATFRPSNALWASPGFTRTYFGQAGDLPVPGQYDQDDDNWEIGIFRPSTGLWSVLGERRFYFGSSEDWPVPADYEGDHWTDFAVFRGSSGLWSVQEVTRLYYGAEGDVPVTGRVPRHFGPTPSPPPPVLDSDDYDGDGTSDIAVFRPSVGLWAIKDLTHLYFGKAGDVPVSGDYNGDGTTDIAFYRPSLGLWSVRGLTRA